MRVLTAALQKRGGLEEALAQPGFARLPLRDRAFARALVMAALRRMGPIDRALDARLLREPPRPIRDILRLGAAQLFFLDVPNFAAVMTTVELAPRPLRALVNAVMRGLTRGGAPAVDFEALAPAWLFARWRAAYGAEAAMEIAEWIAKEPATDLTPLVQAQQGLAQALEAEILSGGSMRTARRGDPSTWPGYSEGRWWIQDAAAAIPARLLDIRGGESALDVCAAPGGKSLQLAAAGAKVTALDRSAQRMRRVAAGLARTGLSAELVVADAITWGDERRFDAVLVDAPCSATGTFRRHPDVLWNARPGDIASMANIQGALIAAAALRVKSGGRLVYSVCSLEGEEGEAQVAALLKSRADFVSEPIEAGEGGAPAKSRTPEGWLRILPPHLAGGVDGFFVARLRRLEV